ncbi:2-octaprenyl-3-methyl-6-methoxy-1,4-benzoquinol hydroxylase [Halomonas litopenaei]|uniref:2-octaprenyl-3-methyl-6-methoxy-1,4-benzoquinol hydroxylase n=1 Tax=Halomonas litopenaei TaxID=2109328 RepID=A0ABX5IWQ3_9GAMM|nr:MULTISPECIES: UbiH/UbiF/VisC/COQ6 family ubiquinone biosynthesis hydroxylase [Halomonas]PTL91500.1 2-octaprenyl-3-methyl-6-methoxy-1,4-benzoquinol hydroxylase [Halomonas sp. SYSU XM8]PTL95022.1 2-octaprenyl-3-methyl-6-methoxy-1,4-benzoquinol hydroxylase [Halomonas litopenaei]
MKEQAEDSAAKAAPTGVDVVIAGIGMVGAVLAVLLAREGWTVAMVDPRPGPLDSDDLPGSVPAPRVSALTPVSRRLLEGLGAWPRIDAWRATPYTAMQVWDADGSGEVGFRADQAGVPVLGHIVENDVILAALEAELSRLPQVQRLHGRKVVALDDGAVRRRVTLDDGSVLAAPLVVGADGARSPLRELAGIAVREQDTGQCALVTTVKTERRHGGVARQAFLATGPLAFLPLTVAGDSHYCSIVWSTTPQEAERLAALSPAALGQAMAEALDHRLGAVEVLDEARSFPLSQRHAERYHRPGLALIGDAAHSIHPLAGQGVNLGFLDAAVLAEELLNGRRRGVAPGGLSLLARYERRRRGDNAMMLVLMEGFRRLFGSRHPGLTLARNLGLSGVDRLSPIKRLIMQQATGSRGRLPLSCR